YLKNRRLFRMRVGSELRADLARQIPWSEAREHPFAHTAGVGRTPNLKTARKSLQGLNRLIPRSGDLRIRRPWAGLLDATPDAVPVLGGTSEVPGFIGATGCSGHGFAMGPIAGKLMAELIVDGESSLDLHDLEFSRFNEGRAGKPRNVL